MNQGFLLEGREWKEGFENIWSLVGVAQWLSVDLGTNRSLV